MKDNLDWPLVILLLCILGAIWAANIKPSEGVQLKHPCSPLIECEDEVEQSSMRE